MLLMMSENLSKHVEKPINNKLYYIVASWWSFLYIISWCTERWISSFMFIKYCHYYIMCYTCYIQYLQNTLQGLHSKVKSLTTFHWFFGHSERKGFYYRAWQEHSKSSYENNTSFMNLVVINHCNVNTVVNRRVSTKFHVETKGSLAV